MFSSNRIENCTSDCTSEFMSTSTSSPDLHLPLDDNDTSTLAPLHLCYSTKNTQHQNCKIIQSQTSSFIIER